MRAKQPRPKGESMKLAHQALEVCRGNRSELARRLHYPPTTVYNWFQCGRVPPYHEPALQKIIRAPRRRERGRTRSEARAV
jgi:Bacterial regulatory protein, Fis family